MAGLKFAAAGVDRPLTSHEIQARMGRMPTRAERQAFSAWREINPGVHLNEDDARKAMCDEIEKNDWLDRMSGAERAAHELAESVGDDAAEKIAALVRAMLAEARS